MKGSRNGGQSLDALFITSLNRVSSAAIGPALVAFIVLLSAASTEGRLGFGAQRQPRPAIGPVPRADTGLAPQPGGWRAFLCACHQALVCVHLSAEADGCRIGVAAQAGPLEFRLGPDPLRVHIRLICVHINLQFIIPHPRWGSDSDARLS